MATKKMFIPDVRYGQGNALDLREVRQMALQNPVLFMERTQKLINDGKLSFAGFRNLGALQAALADVKVPVRMEVPNLGERAITASAFPLLVGSTVIAMINEAYAAVPTIGDQLVEDFEDNKKVTTIAAVSALDKNIDTVKETEEFPEISATEEKAEIRHKRNGRLLKISQEMIDENEIPDIVNRINALAMIASDWVEEQTLSRVTDYNGSAASPAEPYVYRPDGTGTALFSATANTPGTRAPSGTCIQNNAFVDETNLETARIRLASMVNNMGKRINIPMSAIRIFVPNAIIGAVLKVFNSEMVPGVENEKSNWGPGGRWNMPTSRVLSTPKLDDLSTSAWYYGAPQMQFKRKWKLRFEYVTLGSDTESYLKARIAFQARIAWDVEIGATDYCYWLQNLAAATFPKDE